MKAGSPASASGFWYEIPMLEFPPLLSIYSSLKTYFYYMAVETYYKLGNGRQEGHYGNRVYRNMYKNPLLLPPVQLVSEWQRDG